MKRIMVLGAALLVAPVIADGARAGQAEPSMADRLVNDPRPEALRPYGQRIPPEVRGDKTVQFGKALRVPIGSVPKAFGEIGVVTPTLKPVKDGDRIVVAFWARAQKTEADAPGKVCRVQLEATPVVRSIFEQAFDVTPTWTLYKLSGKADRAYAAGQLNAAFHLGCAKQTIDLGPVFVLDYGQ